VAKYTLPYFQVQRAKMILYAAQGLSNDEIAACLDTRREGVSLWRKRLFTDRLAGLEEHARPGRPRTFPPALVVQIKPFACELPAKHGRPRPDGVPVTWCSKSSRAAWLPESRAGATISHCATHEGKRAINFTRPLNASSAERPELFLPLGVFVRDSLFGNGLIIFLRF